MEELLTDVPEAQAKGEAAEGFSLLQRVERTGDSTEIPDGHPSVDGARGPDHSQHQGSASQARELRSDYRRASVGESQVEAKDASRAEPLDLPQIGALVRCKASLLRSPRRTSGRVKAVVSQEYGQAVVIQSIWGDEVTVTAKEYSRFFEECDPRDIARQYWES
jgi:hypothetical protein